MKIIFYDSSNVDNRDFYIQNSYSSRRDVASRKTIRSEVIVN
jgi:hypothetical protein